MAYQTVSIKFLARILMKYRDCQYSKNVVIVLSLHSYIKQWVVKVMSYVSPNMPQMMFTILLCNDWTYLFPRELNVDVLGESFMHNIKKFDKCPKMSRSLRFTVYNNTPASSNDWEQNFVHRRIILYLERPRFISIMSQLKILTEQSHIIYGTAQSCVLFVNFALHSIFRLNIPQHTVQIICNCEAMGQLDQSNWRNYLKERHQFALYPSTKRLQLTF